MNLLEYISGHPKPPGYSRRKELEKLKNNLSSLKWQESMAEFDDGEEKITTTGITAIREVAGIIENKLRVFGFESPKHFSCKRDIDSDEYIFGFTDSGSQALAKKGIKLPERKTQ